MKRQNRWISCADPDEAWKESWGWLLRIRYIVGVTVADSVAAGVSILLSFPGFVTTGIVLVGLIVLAVLSITRVVVLYTLGTSEALHRLTHAMRDDIAALLEVARDPTQSGAYREKYGRFHADVADRIAEIFKQLTRDSTINCAIRLAERTNGADEYATKGRSKNMNPSRADMSEPIPGDKGIVRFLRDKQRRGVYIIEDIGQATRDEAWHKTPTDDLRDVKTLIVAPINGYSTSIDGTRNEKTMLGMLYVTSRGNRFNQFHCELLMGLADLLGLTYPIITGKLG